MPLFRNLGDGDVRTKTGPLDLVTAADEAAERRITAGLRREFPGCMVVGEEAASADPALLNELAGADLAFVVDPVDGTSNFAAGLTLFGVMAAAFRHGGDRRRGDPRSCGRRRVGATRGGCVDRNARTACGGICVSPHRCRLGK